MRQQTPLYLALGHCFLKAWTGASFDSLMADATLYGARTVKLAPAVAPHSKDCQLLMHESFLKEHFEIMPNMKNFPLLSGALSIRKHWCMWGVKVVSLFLGCLEATQETEVGCGNLNAATCTYMPTVRHTFQSWKIYKHENTLIMLIRFEAFMCEVT